MSISSSAPHIVSRVERLAARQAHLDHDKELTRRDEDNLVHSMAWRLHHNRYDENYALDTLAGLPFSVGAS